MSGVKPAEDLAVGTGSGPWPCSCGHPKGAHIGGGCVGRTDHPGKPCGCPKYRESVISSMFGKPAQDNAARSAREGE